MTNKYRLTIASFLFLSLLGAYALHLLYASKPKPVTPSQVLLNTSPFPSPSLSPSPSPTMTPAQREAKYGPCTRVPILMYHHIAETDVAKEKNFTYLNVTPETFATHLEYLRTKNYTVIPLSHLAEFFQGARTLPAKPIILTFDDAYDDFFSNAVPHLRQYEYPATVFVPTGLLENPGYGKWADLAASPAYIYFANHTWSHRSAFADLATETFEITTADTQLKDHNANPDRLFAYPYGTPSAIDQQVLASLSYQLAVTTTPGVWQCAKQKYVLPRLRIGNAALSNFGL